MSIQSFLLEGLGCSERECVYIESLMDKFPCADINGDDLKEFSQIGAGIGLADFVISRIFDKVIYHFTEDMECLEEDKFDTYIDGVCSTLSYDEDIINSENDLDELVDIIKG